MSNRGMATTFFVIFMCVFVYEMETLKGDTERAINNVGFNMRPTQVINNPEPQGYDRIQSALALTVSNYLSYFVDVTGKVVTKIHPELKDELRYDEFEVGIQNRRSTKGVLKFDPLKLEFKDDYDKLRARYETEHPGTIIPE